MTTPPQTQAAVRNLQRYLRRLSFEDPRIPRVPIDGVFDTATAEALRAFQSAYGLPESGRADRVTWERLFEEFRRVERQNDRTPVLHLFPTAPADYVLRRGEESITVSFLQLLLQELRVIYESLEEEAITGIFDEITERNIRRIQERALLPVTGEVDLVTWNRILRDFSHYADGTP